MRLTGWKKIFPGDHIERMYGTFAENDAYCSKESEMTVFGIRPMENGKKRKLQDVSTAVVEAAASGVDIGEVAVQVENRSVYVQYHNGLQKLYDHAVRRRLKSMSNDVAPEVHFFWGPPGSGKTREVYSLEPDVYKVSPSDKYKWFDGYYGQPAVLFDNITPQNISPVDLLIAIDRYYSEMPRKGGFVGWRPQRIYLTTVYPDRS